MMLDTKPDNYEPAAAARSSAPPRAPAQDPRLTAQCLRALRHGRDGRDHRHARRPDRHHRQQLFVGFARPATGAVVDRPPFAPFRCLCRLPHSMRSTCWRRTRPNCAGASRSPGPISPDLITVQPAHGVPLLPGRLPVSNVELVDRVDAGDHVILLGRVLRIGYGGDSLVFAGGRYGRLPARGR